MTAAGPIESPGPGAVAGAAGPCMLCGARAWRPYLRSVLDYLTDEWFDINRCTCGLMVTQPMPTAGEIDRYYPPRYRGNRHGFTGNMRVILRRRAIESQFPKGFRGRILDVGCGNGAFALAMHERGWKVCATEIDTATVERLRSAGIDCKTPEAAEREGFGEPLNAVTCWHVMEHVERPREVAEWARTQLKADGVFQATVPNAACLQAKMFGRNWLHLDVPRHRYHFTPGTFRELLTQAGFAVERQNVFAIEYDWFGVIQSALNAMCSRPNGLFEKLTGAEGQHGGTALASGFDAVVSYAACMPLAGISLPAILIAAAMGDGGTLTLTCRS